jgi:hypothetical protein
MWIYCVTQKFVMFPNTIHKKIKVHPQYYSYMYMAVTCVVKLTYTQKKYTRLIKRLNRYDQRPSKIDNVSDNYDMNVHGGSGHRG